MAQSIKGTVVAIDSQGNAVTDITVSMLGGTPRDEGVRIECEGHQTNSIFPNDHGQPDMSYIATLDAEGNLVLMLTGDSASKFLGMKVGSSVKVKLVICPNFFRKGDTPRFMSQLLVEKIAKSYPSGREQLDVLSDVSFSLEGGQSLAILGPSGSGKSTLLYILGTLEKPSDGAISLDGVNPFDFPPEVLADFRNERVGFVFQEHFLLPQLSVQENVLVPTVARGGADTRATERARQLIERVGLAERANHRPSELSGGERQRVAIARALIMSPDLVLADEPTGNLDRKTAESIGHLLKELQAEQQSLLVVVTHDDHFAAFFDRSFHLYEGNLVDAPL